MPLPPASPEVQLPGRGLVIDGELVRASQDRPYFMGPAFLTSPWESAAHAVSPASAPQRLTLVTVAVRKTMISLGLSTFIDDCIIPRNWVWPAMVVSP